MHHGGYIHFPFPPSPKRPSLYFERERECVYSKLLPVSIKRVLGVKDDPHRDRYLLQSVNQELMSASFNWFHNLESIIWRVFLFFIAISYPQPHPIKFQPLKSPDWTVGHMWFLHIVILKSRRGIVNRIHFLLSMKVFFSCQQVKMLFFFTFSNLSKNVLPKLTLDHFCSYFYCCSNWLLKVLETLFTKYFLFFVYYEQNKRLRERKMRPSFI